MIITLLAIQAWKWHQARALAQLSIEVSRQTQKDLERYNELKRLEERSINILIINDTNKVKVNTRGNNDDVGQEDFMNKTSDNPEAVLGLR